MKCTPVRRRTNQQYYPNVGNVINQIFNTSVSDLANSPRSGKQSYVASNIFNYDDRLELLLAIPGYHKEDVSISVEEDVLLISAEPKADTEDKNYRLKEWNKGGFTKRYTLDSSFAQDKISAAFENGVLTIVFPKKEEAIPEPAKAIQID